MQNLKQNIKNHLKNHESGIHSNSDPFIAASQQQPLQIGKTPVTITKFLAEGGFARVYSGVRSGDGMPVAVKRIITPPDQPQVSQQIKQEVQLMRKLKHKNMWILWMPRLINLLPALHRGEVWRIFSDCCEAVAYLHYMEPPVVHRDIKVENILISSGGSGRFKLCDFGSCTTRIVKPGTVLGSREIAEIQEELDRVTTLQYRAPEMCDLYRRRGLTEKTDVWALGVLLYKLCYYTTPFEDDGKLAILNCRYEIPSFPSYSRRVVNMIQQVFTVEPASRPNIFMVLEAVSKVLQRPCPIQNKYPAEEIAPPVPQKDTPVPQQQAQRPAVQEAPKNIAPRLSPPTHHRRGRANKKGLDKQQSNSSFVSPNDTPASSADQRELQAVFSGGFGDDPFAPPTVSSGNQAVASDGFPFVATDGFGSQASAFGSPVDQFSGGSQLQSPAQIPSIQASNQAKISAFEQQASMDSFGIPIDQGDFASASSPRQPQQIGLQLTGDQPSSTTSPQTSSFPQPITIHTPSYLPPQLERLPSSAAADFESRFPTLETFESGFSPRSAPRGRRQIVSASEPTTPYVASAGGLGDFGAIQRHSNAAPMAMPPSTFVARDEFAPVDRDNQDPFDFHEQIQQPITPQSPAPPQNSQPVQPVGFHEDLVHIADLDFDSSLGSGGNMNNAGSEHGSFGSSGPPSSANSPALSFLAQNLGGSSSFSGGNLSAGSGYVGNNVVHSKPASVGGAGFGLGSGPMSKPATPNKSLAQVGGSIGMAYGYGQQNQVQAVSQQEKNVSRTNSTQGWTSTVTDPKYYRNRDANDPFSQLMPSINRK